MVMYRSGKNSVSIVEKDDEEEDDRNQKRQLQSSSDLRTISETSSWKTKCYKQFFESCLQLVIYEIQPRAGYFTRSFHSTQVFDRTTMVQFVYEICEMGLNLEFGNTAAISQMAHVILKTQEQGSGEDRQPKKP